MSYSLERPHEDECEHNYAAFKVGPLTINPVTRKADVSGRRLSLTPTEFTLLASLGAQPGRVFSLAELTHAVWGENWYGDRNNLAVHVCKIRAKLSAVGAPQDLLRTVRSVGYSLDAPKQWYSAVVDTHLSTLNCPGVHGGAPVGPVWMLDTFTCEAWSNAEEAHTYLSRLYATGISHFTLPGTLDPDAPASVVHGCLRQRGGSIVLTATLCHLHSHCTHTMACSPFTWCADTSGALLEHELVSGGSLNAQAAAALSSTAFKHP